MELTLAAGAGLIFVSILLSPVAVRTGAPLLLFFLVIGMLLGEDGPGGVHFNDFEMANELGSVALAIILFSGGLATGIGDVRKAWLPAALLASLGVCLTVGLTGGVLTLLLGFPLWHALLLGAVVGSTDAAATFMLLQQRGVPLKGRNKETLLLESGLNDPIAIFLTLLLLGIVDHGTGSLGWSTLGILFSQLGLGAVLGVGGGFALSWTVNRVALPAGLYSVFVLAGGLLLFGVTAALEGSGFLAVYVAGILVRHRVAGAVERIVNFHEAMAWLSQITLFLMLGLLVTPRDLAADAFHGLIIAAVLMLVARPLAVIPCLAPLGFSLREQLFIGWVGLRGAVPIFLAILPVISPGPVTVELFNQVFVCVIASLVLQGWTIPLAGRLFGVEAASAGEATTKAGRAT